MIIPLQLILLQILTMLLTVIIEAYLFNLKFKINRQKSIELSFLINFMSYFFNWIFWLFINWLLSRQFPLKLQFISYTILGKISDLSLIDEVLAFVISFILFNFVMVVTLEFFSFNWATKLILIKQNGEHELYDFFVNIISENNAKKLLTIIMANLYSYLSTIIILFLAQIRNI